MPDYSACANPVCERRLMCSRYRMKYGLYQSIAGFKAEGCSHYIEVGKDDIWEMVSEKEADERTAQFLEKKPW